MAFLLAGAGVAARDWAGVCDRIPLGVWPAEGIRLPDGAVDAWLPKGSLVCDRFAGLPVPKVEAVAGVRGRMGIALIRSSSVRVSATLAGFGTVWPREGLTRERGLDRTLGRFSCCVNVVI